MSNSKNQPVVGITTDIITINDLERRMASSTYARAIIAAGGTPVFLEPDVALTDRYLRLCDAFVLTGGDDPIMEHFGIATHPAAIKVHPLRQSFELSLLKRLTGESQADLVPKPTLGVCLGMQYMALHAGGKIDQHLPDSTPTASRHWEQDHAVQGERLIGTVHSKHRQAITDPGSLEIAARSEDGLIEAITDPAKPFFLGVQWHPERTNDNAVGQAIFDELIACSRG